MSGERILASYIVRVTVKEGERHIQVLDTGRGTTARFDSYFDLVRHLELGEEPDSPDSPRNPRPGR